MDNAIVFILVSLSVILRAFLLSLCPEWIVESQGMPDSAWVGNAEPDFPAVCEKSPPIFTHTFVLIVVNFSDWCVCTDGLLRFYFVIAFVIIREVEHLFIYLVDAAITSLGKCLFKAPVHFLLNVLGLVFSVFFFVVTALCLI